MKDRSQDPAPASSAQGFAFTLAVLGILFVATFSCQLPDGLSPAWLRQYQGTFRTLWPQGWSFFANSADADVVTAFRTSPGGAVTGPVLELSMSASDAWGLERTASSVYQQVSYLGGQVPGGDWTACAAALSTGCLGHARTYRLTNTFQPAQVCGSMVLVRAKPSSAPTTGPAAGQRPGSVVNVQVTCPK